MNVPFSFKWLRLYSDLALLDSHMVEALALNYSAVVLAVLGKEPFAAGESPWRKEMRDMCAPTMHLSDSGVATIPIHGPLAHRPSLMETLMGVEDTGAITRLVQSATQNPAVRAMKLDVNSPGGFWIGSMDLAEAVAAANAVKPVVAHITGQGSSLAYLAASQAGKVVMSPGSMAGSIGVIARVEDTSEAMAKEGVKVHVIRNTGGDLKNAGMMEGEPVNAAALAQLQSQVDGMFGAFSGAVTRARPQVKAASMRGQSFMAGDAHAAGLVDYIGNQAVAHDVLLREMQRRPAASALD